MYSPYAHALATALGRGVAPPSLPHFALRTGTSKNVVAGAAARAIVRIVALSCEPELSAPLAFMSIYANLSQLHNRNPTRLRRAIEREATHSSSNGRAAVDELSVR
jgi:hypothetical protein